MANELWSKRYHRHPGVFLLYLIVWTITPVLFKTLSLGKVCCMKINGFVFDVHCFIDFYVAELIKWNVSIFFLPSVISKSIISRRTFLVRENNSFAIIKKVLKVKINSILWRIQGHAIIWILDHYRLQV